MTAYAHTPNDSGHWHELGDHLAAVAERAGVFARSIGAHDLGEVAGRYHDLGKLHPQFQEYLRRAHEHPAKRMGHGIDHKAAGAALIAARSPILPLIVMAHHGGLDDAAAYKKWMNGPRVHEVLDDAVALALTTLPEIGEAGVVPLPAHLGSDPLDTELFLRLIFSCLIDADFLDTEQHFDGRAHQNETDKA